MTSAFSGKASPIAPYAGDEHQDSDRDGELSDILRALVGWTREDELNAARTQRQLHPNETVVSTPNPGSLSIDHRFPPGVVIFRDHERRTLRRRRAEVDLNLAWFVVPDRSPDGRRRRQRLDSGRHSDVSSGVEQRCTPDVEAEVQ